ncbi:uncharacterized protein LOC108734442 isoform X2 [Agrilus planipennis]|nr:uncharacterized protein LOC108734442 isoform X2 [Agrilus planipennis]
MISGIIIMLFVICYCCHRSQQKRENHINTYWREPAILTSDIFTIDGAQLIEVAEYQVEDSTPSTPGQPPSGPPPPYDSIVDSAPPYDSVVDTETELEHENETQNRRKSRRWSCSQAVVVPVDDCEPPPSYERALKLQNGEHM